MQVVKIIGVPEHFNLPWHMAIEESAFLERGVDLQWTDIPEGTGRMCQMLASGEADMGIILTEGIVKSIAEGNPAKIVQEYIASPLQWGIHVGARSPYKHIGELRETVAAISRYGSGSHLMAYVMAQDNGWDTRKLSFNIIHNLHGAVEALTAGTADYFMWEHFTTKPLVDQGVFRHLGDCPTPWPCFMVVARNQFIAQHGRVLSHILEIINAYTSEFKGIPSIDRTLANRYGQHLEDVQQWLGITQWSQSPFASESLENVQNTLMKLGLIPKKESADRFLI